MFSKGPKGTAVAGLIVGFPGVAFFMIFGLGIIGALLGTGSANQQANLEAVKQRPSTSDLTQNEPLRTPDVLPDSTEELSVAIDSEMRRLTEKYKRELAEYEVLQKERSNALELIEQTNALIDKHQLDRPRLVDYYPRNWKAAAGDYTTKAEFVSTDGISVSLRKTDLQIVTVPIAKLSKDDQDYIAKSKSDREAFEVDETSWQTENNRLKKLLADSMLIVESATSMPPNMPDLDEITRKIKSAKDAAATENERIVKLEQQALDNAKKEAAEREANRVRLTKVTWANVREGMTYNEVIAIIGPPSEELSSSEIGGIRTVMYKWDGVFLANANAMFQNGKLITKAQYGL
ncbi:hypothetical protein RMSM_04049 [Rhodopirellula maiorica SM1]|uniref:SLA1 homology domain-containing protein n=1 Tax=Rhodopirellula maiorica SM1 TaxID=1265738 RepID=M5RIJ8_9BACT|nr:hypothetical protein RMSM_04049 [Rhodopirellula maiorica SM1]